MALRGPKWAPGSPLQALGSRGRKPGGRGQRTWEGGTPATCNVPASPSACVHCSVWLLADLSPVRKHCSLLAAGPLHTAPQARQAALARSSSRCRSVLLPSGLREQPVSSCGAWGAVLSGCLCPSVQPGAWHTGGALEMLTEPSARPTQNFSKRVLSLPGERLCALPWPSFQDLLLQDVHVINKEPRIQPSAWRSALSSGTLYPSTISLCPARYPFTEGLCATRMQDRAGAHLAHPLLLARLSPLSSWPPSFCLSPARSAQGPS